MITGIRSFNRFELKYYLPISILPQLKEDLKKYMIPDSHGDKEGNYALTSLYYDTPDYRFYREKVDGIKYRRKLRIRYYETEKPLTSDSIVFVEIKQRVDRVTQKRRVPMSYKEALDLCNNAKLPLHYEKRDEAVLQEIQQMIIGFGLQPTCITSYFRQARQGTRYDPGLRITFDTNIRERHQDLDLSSKKIGQFMIPPDKCILEIKANEHVPLWIVHLISEYNIRLIRISKYCQALETASFVGEKKYLFAS